MKCVQCGKEGEGLARYCSPKCRYRANYMRHRKESIKASSIRQSRMLEEHYKSLGVEEYNKYVDRKRKRSEHKDNPGNSNPDSIYYKYFVSYRSTWLRRKYGLTLQEFDNLLLFQNNQCAICLKHLEYNSDRSVHVDHCHTTNKVRGVLCNKCNMMLGYCKDNITILQSAIKYLEASDG
jgi:hypothetical protein